MIIKRFGGRATRHFLYLVLSLFMSPIAAQGTAYHTAESGYGIRLGQTRPLYLSEIALPTDPAKLKDAKRFKPTWVPNFSGRRHEPARNPDALPFLGDPLFRPDLTRNPTVDILPTVNVAGMTEAQAGSGVPDVNGEAGRDYFVQMVNVTYFRVYNKMGTAVSLPIPCNTIWSQVGLTSFGDPILLYDQEVDRWLLTEFASVGARTVLVAVSDTPDPRGTWTAYKFQTPRFPDYPKYGIWRDGYYFTANETGNNFPIYAINREDMLAGEDTVRFQRLTVPKIGGVGFEVGQPVDWDGLNPPPDGSPMILVKLNDDAWGTTARDEILLHRITIDWDTSSNSMVEVEGIPTTPFDTDGCQLESTGGFSCIPQPNNQGIDGGEWIIMNKAVYRHFADHEAFVMCFLVDVTGEDVGGIRWMEFRRTPGEEWHIYQEGTVGSDDGLHRFMGAIAIDGRGNIGLGYGVSGYSKFPSLRFTGRYSTDPPGEMTFTEYEVVSGGGSWGSDRYGDYFSMSVDPADESTFWFTGQYIPSNNDWSTRIVAFAASRDTFDLLPVTLVGPSSSPQLGDQETIVIDVLNRGLRDVDTFAVAYQFNGGPWVLEPAGIDTLAVDSVYRHAFEATASFTSPGLYPLRIATSLELDGNRLNDTLSFTLIKYAYRDLQLEYVPAAQPELVCSDYSNNTIRLVNAGVDTARQAVLELHLNSTILDTIEWEGVLSFGGSELLDIPVQGLLEGDNELALVILGVNGDTDESSFNDTIRWTLTARPDGEPAFLSFRTDNFPMESTWTLRDDSNNILAQGGPFALSQHVYQESFCLQANACYTFTVYDSFGDGMSAQGVTGFFEITNSEGQVLADLDRPNFGSQITATFCLSDTCLLTLNSAGGPASSPVGQDGFLMAEAMNGFGPVTYSINGVVFQANGLFNGLAAGTYLVTARDAAGCEAYDTVHIAACTLDVLLDVTPAVGGDVGAIAVLISGATGAVEISFNGGAFGPDTLFAMLEPGEYMITVRDSLGCQFSQTVQVSSTVSTSGESNLDAAMVISPNPGRGLFDVTARLASNEFFVPMMVLDGSGEIIMHSSLVRLNDLYHGQLVLQQVPPGTYFVAIRAGSRWLARRLINLP